MDEDRLRQTLGPPHEKPLVTCTTSLPPVRVNTGRATIRERKRRVPPPPTGFRHSPSPHIPALVLPDRPHQGPSLKICGGVGRPRGRRSHLAESIKLSFMPSRWIDGRIFLCLVVFVTSPTATRWEYRWATFVRKQAEKVGPMLTTTFSCSQCDPIAERYAQRAVSRTDLM